MRLISLLIVLCLFSPLFGKVYDCFLFLNELELLEIRLNELNDYVDKFVLVESSRTHRLGTPKPYFFEQEKQRFAPYLHKIIHIKLDRHIEKIHDRFDREIWERNQIMLGLKECQPEDLILISDADEFIPGSIIPRLNHATMNTPVIGFLQNMYRWKLNRSAGQPWSGTAALRYKNLVSRSPQEVRDLVRCSRVPLWKGGWHFTCIGGYERSSLKLYSITEGFDHFSQADWIAHVKAHPLVPIDYSFPKFVQRNQIYLMKLGLIDKE